MNDVSGLNADAKLTSEARVAIPSYLWKLFIPSAVTLTIISGIIGYAINDIAKKEAFDTALSKAYDSANQLQTKELEQANQIYQAKIEIDQLGATEKKEAKEIDNFLQQQRALNQGDYGALAKQLLADDNFKKSLATTNVDELGKINNRVANIEKVIENLRTAGGITPAGPHGSVSQCPLGSYAVGFEFLDESGLAHGALYAGRLTCKPFFPSGS